MGIQEKGLIDPNTFGKETIIQRRFSFIRDFEPYRRYLRDNVIYHEGIIYRAFMNFHASDMFESRDWEPVTFTSDIVVVDFQPNTETAKDTMIFHDGFLFRARNNFVTGDVFNYYDWEKVGISGVSWGDIQGIIEDQPDLQKEFTVMAEDFNAEINETNSNLKDLRNDFNSWIGRGGYLDAYDFGTPTPTQTQLTDYALSQIPSITDPTQLWNGTRVVNLNNNDLWMLTNTQDTDPPVFDWSNQGPNSLNPFGPNEGGYIVGGDPSTDGPEYVFAQPNNKGKIDIEALQKMILGAVYPVGCFYTQYPVYGQQTITNMFPTREAPATLFGGTWTEQFANEDVFFRTGPTLGTRRGLVWNDSTKTWENSSTSVGVEPDAIRNITGETAASHNVHYAVPSSAVDVGAFTRASISGNGTTIAGSTNPYPRAVLQIDTSRVVPTDTTNHPKNRLIKVWKRTA